MSEQFTIRRATPDDIETLVEMRLKMQREIHADEMEVDWTALQETCRRYFAETLPTQQFVAFVAQAEGRIIATSGLSFVSRPPSATSNLQSEGYVTSMYTLPAWRGRGVATALLNAAIEHAKYHGARLVFLHTSDAGRPVYEKLGFAEYPRYMQVRL
ncbi:MAG TPA: GNAT family N-acetyltransferase [Dehalococcoidia bacterium]|jgi:GNAT superfamily N-acetyltransferase|nr:GNAT family N-acetyltransferase [Dehalococcoidia bacterium]